MLQLKCSFQKFYNHCNLIQRKSLGYINSSSRDGKNYQEKSAHMIPKLKNEKRQCSSKETENEEAGGQLQQ